MKQLKQHIVEGDSANHQLTIEVLDEPGQGGACHLYEIRGFDTESNIGDVWKKRYGKSSDHTTMLFQNGPIKEYGVNGVTHEALLAILIDRMESFQAGPYANPKNAEALDSLNDALECLQERTKARIARGVEGTHAK